MSFQSTSNHKQLQATKPKATVVSFAFLKHLKRSLIFTHLHCCLAKLFNKDFVNTPHLNRWYEAFNSGVARMIDFRYSILA